MKKRISMMLAALCLLGAVCMTGASAAEAKTPPAVRVNDVLVNFPDTQPYIDSNSRTMIPVKFVSQALGAEVSWVQSTQTAVIALDHTTVKVPIGSKTITVIKGGKTSTITMDTQAVNNFGRTCVPISFVAEALGAYVGWSDYYKTVEICKETLTRDEILRLRGYEYCLYGGGRYMTDESGKLTPNTDSHLIGGTLFAPHEVNASFLNKYGFSNAREFLLRHKYPSDSSVKGALSGATWKSNDNNQARLYMNEAIALTNQEWSGKGIAVSFRTDTSCLYQDDYYDGFHYSFRGILSLHVTDATAAEASIILKNLGVQYRTGHSDYSIDFEVKVNCSSSTVVIAGGYLLSENQ